LQSKDLIMTEVEFAPETAIIEELVAQRDLVVFNDDVNTFDHVIESLIKVCKHELEQAEQCTWIIHFNGKCQVKRGEFEKLEPMCTALLDRGISAEIQ
jgi:ATP-dependent Clp protease adaptor protein ClpS